MMEMQLLITALMDRDGPALQDQIKVNDEQIKAFFDKHPDKFKTPENFTVRHILVATKAMGGEKVPTDDEAKAKIAKIQAELAAGKTFEAAVKEYSDDPGSKDKGGLYENTPFGSFVPEFEDAVRKQAIGKVGAPVKSNYGYHLILVEKINPAVAQTFEAAKEAATKQATTEVQERVMKAYMDAAKKEVGFVRVEEPKSAAPARAAAEEAHEVMPAEPADAATAAAPAAAAAAAPAPKVAQ
jgi:parvulin-like peptidyl-prolyl isomerase